jgi:hypothetical protein
MQPVLGKPLVYLKFACLGHHQDTVHVLAVYQWCPRSGNWALSPVNKDGARGCGGDWSGAWGAWFGDAVVSSYLGAGGFGEAAFCIGHFAS